MSKRINRAISGRRNRCHAMGPIFRYNSFDTETKAELKKLLDDMTRKPFQYAMIPEQIKVTPAKSPRFMQMPAYGELRSQIDELLARVEELEKNQRQILMDSHPPVDLKSAIMRILGEAQIPH